MATPVEVIAEETERFDEALTSPPRNILGAIDFFSGRRLKGWVADLTSPTSRLVVELQDNGVVLMEFEAGDTRSDLESILGAHVQHGFSVDISTVQIINPYAVRFIIKGSQSELLLPNFWTPIHTVVELNSPDYLTGWSFDGFNPDSHLQIRFFQGVEEIGSTIANAWRSDLESEGIGRGDHAFTFTPTNPIVDSALITLRVESVPNQLSEEPTKNRVSRRKPKLFDSSSPSPPRPVADWRKEAERFFDTTWYLSQIPAGTEATDAFGHWWNRGRHKGLSPHCLFDPKFYVGQLDKVIELKDSFLHFLHRGTIADIDPHPCFSSKWYRQRYVERDEEHPWIDYILFGADTGRDPNWLFSSALLAKELGPDIDPLKSYLESYLTRLGKSTHSPHPLLDLSSLLQQHKDIDQYSPYLSFWTAYRTREIRTHVYFDPKYYLSQVKGREVFGRAIADYMLFGEAENLRPVPLFEPSWYRSHYGESKIFGTLLEDFVHLGEKAYRHPCPGFDPRFYLETHNDVARSGRAPLKHFISSGQREARAISRRFDIKWYVEKIPEEYRDRALEYWLDNGRQSGHTTHPAVDDGHRLSSTELEQFLCPDASASPVIAGLKVALASPISTGPIAPVVRSQAWLVDAFERDAGAFSKFKSQQLKCNEPITRVSAAFDHNQESAYRSSLKDEFNKRRVALPKVSVVIPTRNRRQVIGRAIRSVLSQTHQDFELIIVDDGGVDNTDVYVKNFWPDPRIRYIQKPALGVSAARNEGILSATSDYVAYLDSDNYWEPLYLETMLQAMLVFDLKAGYAALRAFNDKADIRYRGDVFDMPSLLRENYIDMNVYMHHRCVIEAGIRFDEKLRRCVDWDFILRASALFAPQYVPIIGCNYVDDSGTLERITTDELSGDFFAVCQRGIDLSPHITGRITHTRRRATIVWPISAEHWKTVQDSLWSAIQHVANSEDELIIINNCLGDSETHYLAALSNMTHNVRVIHLWRSFGIFAATNLASTLAVGELMLLWYSQVTFDSEAVDELLSQAQHSNASVVCPIVIQEDGAVSNEIGIADGTSFVLQPALLGQTDLIRRGVVTGAVPISSPTVLRTQEFIQKGRFSATFSGRYGLSNYSLERLAENPDATEILLSIRLASQGAVTGASQTKDLFKEESALRERWQGSRELELKTPTGFTMKAPSVSKLRNLDWLLCADPSQSARLVMPTTNRQLTIAIRCPAPSGHERFAWGDYHYGLAMCSAIEKHGHKAIIEFREDWSNTQSAGDVILHLRGIIDLKPVQGRLNLVWVISHPDKIRAEEIAAMDRVFVAGPHLKKYFRQRFGVDAYVLLQGTDQTRFCREPSRHPAVSDKALFIGNSRMQIRPIVADSIQRKLPLVVYGKDWENFIPSSFIGGEYIANEELVDWYGSAAVVLNDHWPTMREFGIISNRIFDVVAAGRPVVTDPVDGLDELFLGAAEAYADADQLPEMYGRLAKRRFPEAAKLVRAKHTIENRVQELLREVGIKPR